MRTATASTKLSAVLGATVIALSGCSGGGSGDKGTAGSGAAHASASSGASSSSSKAPGSINRLGDELAITDNGVSPDALQKDVTAPVTQAAADTYVATVKPDEAWSKQLASRYGHGAKPAESLEKQKASLDAAAKEGVKERVFPSRCTDMWHITNAVSRPAGSTFATIHTADDQVALTYSKLGKNTMPLKDVFVDYMTCPDVRVASGDGRSYQFGLAILPIETDDGAAHGYTIEQFLPGGQTYHINVIDQGGYRLTSASLKNEVKRSTVKSAFDAGIDLMPKDPAPGIIAAPHKKMAGTSAFVAESKAGYPLTFMPKYDKTWTEALTNALGDTSGSGGDLRALLYAYVLDEYSRTSDKQECLPSSDLMYVSMGGGTSSLRSITSKTAWYVNKSGGRMASLVDLSKSNGSTQTSPISLDDAFKNAGQCKTVEFKQYRGNPYTLSYDFGTFTTSSGEKAYTRSITSKLREEVPFNHVAMTDVDGVRVTVWSNSDKDLKSDLEKAMKAAKQQPKS